MSDRLLAHPTVESGLGVFGKMPAHGDFVTRRVPSSFLESWDVWLQEAIAISRSQLGERWLEVYLTSPLWRFVLSTNVCGNSSWVGVLMPSVDSVGRHFPLTLCARLDDQSSAFDALEPSWMDWFEKAESLALSCLEADFDLDHFDAALQRIESPECPSPVQRPTVRRNPQGLQAGRHAWRFAMESSAAPHSAYSQLLHGLLPDVFGHFSLWWTEGSERLRPTLLVCQNLPPENGFVSMLDGNWMDRGWVEKAGGAR